MAEFIILAVTAAIVSVPSRLLSVCLLRYLKDDHLRFGVSFTPWPKIIAVCGVSVAVAAVCSCVVVYMLPSWTSMLLRSPNTNVNKTSDPLCFMQPRPCNRAVHLFGIAYRLSVGCLAVSQSHCNRGQVISRLFIHTRSSLLFLMFSVMS
jgi:hypothetical protein